MNTFKRKSLYAALAGLGALGVTDAANAVDLNANGLGSALIYPYYTTRADTAGNAYNSLLSVVNSTSSAKAVKVRFLEGKNSREVLDFNLFLSGYDVWTTAIIPSASGGAKIVTNDVSCTLPPIAAGGVDFVNFAYSGSSDDKGGTSLDRTKEGYVEIIDMGNFFSDTTTFTNVTHVNGVPPGCGKVTDSQASSDIADFISPGGLFGGMTLINVGSGREFTENAVALNHFKTDGTLYFPAGDIRPQLVAASPPVSLVVGADLGVESNSTQTLDFSTAVYVSTWSANTADPVSAVLMAENVLNEYVLDTGTKSGTDWVVTFPTKRFYVNVGTGNAPKLFQRNFNTTAGSCDDVSLNIYDREERTTSTPISFSPPPPTSVNSICWEANVVTFNNSNVLASTNVANIPTGFQNGWLNMGFPRGISGALADVHELINTTSTDITRLGAFGSSFQGGATVTYTGLPVVGFAVQTFNNGTLVVGGVNLLSNYGGSFPHRYVTLVQ